MENKSVGPLMRLKSVEEMVGLKKTEIYRRMKIGDFPQSISLGARAIAWKHAEIEAWVRDTIERSAK